MFEPLFFSAIAVLLVGIALMVWRDSRRKAARRRSLRREDNGIYVWVDFDGTERRSKSDPDAPGGEWTQDNSTGVGGWDSGGDSGGGGD